MESLKRALEQIGRMWANLTATQRVLLGALTAGLVVALVWSSTGATDSWVRVAGAELSDKSRQDIIQRLQQHNQKLEVRGNEIFVPKQDADRVVMDLAGEGTMSDESIWKFLDISDPFGDRYQKDLRVKRALEQKLSSMIRSVEFVRNASVVITAGTDSNRIGVAPAHAKAAVQVELLRGRDLSTQNVLAIANLVAKAVPGLDSEQVVICDNKLNSYSIPKQGGVIGPVTSLREYEKAMEDDLSSRIRREFPTWKVSVRVTARSTSIQKESHRFSNPKAAYEEEHKSVERGTGTGPAKGIKGEEGGAPGVDGGRTEQESKVTNKFDDEETRTVEPAGSIERVAIGVLIPVEVGADNKELAEEEKKLPRFKGYVASVAGMVGEKEITVELLPTRRPEPLPALSESEAATGWLSTQWKNIVLGLLGVAGLIIFFLVIRSALSRDTVEDLEVLASQLSEERAPGLSGSGEGEAARLKQGLQDMVGRSPQAVATSLKSFMMGR